MWPNLHETAHLVAFTKEIVNGKRHFLCNINTIVFTQMNQKYCDFQIPKHKKLQQIGSLHKKFSILIQDSLVLENIAVTFFLCLPCHFQYLNHHANYHHHRHHHHHLNRKWQKIAVQAVSKAQLSTCNML